MYKITVPLSITLPRKTKKDKKVYLNLNIYRNLNFMVNNQAKKAFEEAIECQIQYLPPLNKITLIFALYKGSKRKIDRHNIGCIVQKFFCDALVEFGKLPDDNDDYILKETFYTAGIDKDNPRMEIYIFEEE